MKKGTKKVVESKSMLVGQAFVKYGPEEKYCIIGKVLSQEGPGIFHVMKYNPLTCLPSHYGTELVTLEEMKRDNYHFHGDAEDEDVQNYVGMVVNQWDQIHYPDPRKEG